MRGPRESFINAVLRVVRICPRTLESCKQTSTATCSHVPSSPRFFANADRSFENSSTFGDIKHSTPAIFISKMTNKEIYYRNFVLPAYLFHSRTGRFKFLNPRSDSKSFKGTVFGRTLLSGNTIRDLLCPYWPALSCSGSRWLV